MKQNNFHTLFLHTTQTDASKLKKDKLMKYFPNVTINSKFSMYFNWNQIYI